MLLGALSGFLASSLGWQINLLAIQRGLKRGRTAAFLVGCGAVLGDLFFIWVSFTGAAPLVRNPLWWQTLRWIGVVTILALAIRAFLVHPKPIGQNVARKRNPTRNFILGFLVVVSNPAVFLVWIGVISFIVTHFPEGREMSFRWFFMPGFILGSFVWFVALAAFFLKKIKNWPEEHLRIVSRITAVMLLAVAAILVVEQF
ncbi:MAG: LysE family transporter [Candidatus Omnitrophica bacterium]|nr:LysE family transporter [Candidatus Omnitrophota bacterium]MDD5670347.1 LysE family transporter [Candidatus Omnitrophota bacterium]